MIVILLLYFLTLSYAQILEINPVSCLSGGSTPTNQLLNFTKLVSLSYDILQVEIGRTDEDCNSMHNLIRDRKELEKKGMDSSGVSDRFFMMLYVIQSALFSS